MSDNRRKSEWNGRYGASKVWTGKVNTHVSAWVSAHPAQGGDVAIDLACGEGGDAIWLASQGYSVSGVDFAETAIARAAVAAASAGVDVDWHVSDVTAWRPRDTADLVSLSFFHEHEALRKAAWRAAGALVSGSGTLLIAGHAPDAEDAPGPPSHTRFTADDVVEELGPDWASVVSLVERPGVGGHVGHVMSDVVIAFTRVSVMRGLA